MGRIIDQVEGRDTASGVRCPICGQENRPDQHCRHVRWTFEQGDPLRFARFALEQSPYVFGLGHKPAEIPRAWWLEHGDWIVEQITTRFDVGEGYVFGEVGALDLLARDVWKRFRPDNEARTPDR